MVLAEDGYLPAWLARRDGARGAPRGAILACSVLYAACLGLGFRRLVELDILLYGASLTLEFVALVVLRVREPHLARPFRIRGGLPACAALGALPVLALGAALWRCREETLGPLSSLAIGVALMALGPIVYLARTRRFDERPARR